MAAKKSTLGLVRSISTSWFSSIPKDDRISLGMVRMSEPPAFRALVIT